MKQKSSAVCRNRRKPTQHEHEPNSVPSSWLLGWWVRGEANASLGGGDRTVYHVICNIELAQILWFGPTAAGLPALLPMQTIPNQLASENQATANETTAVLLSECLNVPCD